MLIICCCYSPAPFKHNSTHVSTTAPVLSGTGAALPTATTASP